MADNKEYISTEQDNGTVHISEDVIASIAAAAIGEIEGVAGANVGGSETERRGRKSLAKCVKLNIAEDQITVECQVIVQYGYSGLEVAKNIQDAVCVALDSMAGLKVNAVNVNVCGIAMEKANR